MLRNSFVSIAVLVLFVVPMIAVCQTVQSGNQVYNLSEGKGQNPPMIGIQTDDELLVNNGFETGTFDPWYHNGAWSISTNDPHTGQYCAYDIGNNWIRQDIPPTPAADITSVIVWCRQPEEAIAAIDFYYSNLPYSEDLIWPTAQWAPYDVTSFITPGGIVTGIRMWGYSGGGPDPDETFYDDVSIMAVGAQEISITMTPEDSVIYLGPTGGTFEYTVFIQNNGSTTVSGSAWTSALLINPPDTTEYGPFILRNFNLAPGGVILRDMMQNVPAGAPDGIYHFYGKVGSYPASVWDEDWFEVRKGVFTEPNGMMIEDWKSAGWE